jgi:tetratricopeptide (TPR) repeat protein
MLSPTTCKFPLIPVAFLLSMVAACTEQTGQIEQVDHAATDPQDPMHSMHQEGTVSQHASIGTVDFQVSCDPAVQAEFDRALGLVHHMMYVQARGVFEAITEADPDCAMAYWGIATTFYQPLWGTRPSQDELQRGWRKSETASQLVQTSRERHLIEATGAFFEHPDSADFRDRVQGWVDDMAVAYDAHPEEADTAAFYALSRLTLAQSVEDRGPLYDEAKEILRQIYEGIPAHPGAIHYTIHATDVDGRAENALDMVAAYADIAPEVPHALHMPSHIYVRLGDWPEVIDWNRRSADAALDAPANGAVSHHYIHALDYLLYAYLQQGQDDLARAVLDEALSIDAPYQATFISAFHAAAMPARDVVERHQWDEAVGLEPGFPDYLPWRESLWAEGLTWYARGLGAVHTGDLAEAQAAEARLERLRDQAQADGDEGFAAYIEVDRRILSGWLAQLEGDSDRAVALMQSAAELEGAVEKHPVTPGALLPPNEALGDLLMVLARPDEALEAYRTSEAIWPGRYNTLLGAARAAVAAADEEAARVHYGQLLELAEGSQRPGVTEARQYLSVR